MVQYLPDLFPGTGIIRIKKICDGDPIIWDEDISGYRCRFKILPEGGDDKYINDNYADKYVDATMNPDDENNWEG